MGKYTSYLNLITWICVLFVVQGGWVLLQNCHLGLEFMEELLETITTTESMHDTFRVWITTEPHSQFSITLLQVTENKTVHHVLFTSLLQLLCLASTLLLPLVFHKVHQRSATRNTRRLETNFCRNFTEPVGSEQPAPVEAPAVQCGFSPYCCTGNPLSNKCKNVFY